MGITTSAEFQRKLGHYQDRALVEPVMVTRNGREWVVLLSADEFKRLKRRNREVLLAEDFTDKDVAALRRVRPSTQTAAFDHELDE